MLFRDVEINDTHPNTLLLDKHADYLASYAANKDGYEQTMVEYLRMSGIYWSITAMDIMGRLPAIGSREEILDFIKTCQTESGGIAASIGHDPHILYSLSAVQILATYDALDNEHINIDKLVKYVKSMQQEDGSFYGDKWGEVDLRFSFVAIATLALLHRLDEIDVDTAVCFIMKCHNSIDGGFGSRPGSESHAGLTYCGLGALAITHRLDIIDAELLGWWLCERQLPSGGLNGRPEKLPDLCYSWWVLASLHILGRLHWIDRRKLLRFILACQDEESGGFSDRPGNLCDPFHTHFGLTGISFMAHDYRVLASPSTSAQKDPGEDLDEDGTFAKLKQQLKPINPVFCMPQQVIDKLKIDVQLLKL